MLIAAPREPSKRALILEGFNVAQPLDKILGSIQERGLC